MLRILVFLSTIAVLASAGSKTLSPQESFRFLKLFQRVCSDRSRGSRPPQDGSTVYFCQLADTGPITQTVEHEAKIESSGGEGGRQVVFVQPPSYNYVHNVALKGGYASGPQQTEIYLLPPKVDHSLALQTLQQPPAAVHPQKPSLYFLSQEPFQMGPPRPRTNNLGNSLEGRGESLSQQQAVVGVLNPPPPPPPNAFKRPMTTEPQVQFGQMSSKDQEQRTPSEEQQAPPNDQTSLLDEQQTNSDDEQQTSSVDEGETPSAEGPTTRDQRNTNFIPRYNTLRYGV